jgi:hypothetical protein
MGTKIIFDEATEARLSAPDSKKGKLQRAVLTVVREHEASGALPTSGRFIWYELVQRGVVDKSKARGHAGVKRGEDQNVGDALMFVREAGLVDWFDIADETRTLYEPGCSASVADWHREASESESEKIDRWGSEPAPLILTESRSLAGVLRPIAYRYTAPIASTNGQCGGFLRTDLAPLFYGSRNRCVLYLGDLDLAGDQIELNTRTVLGWSDRWERLALTEAQADDYDLRQFAITKTDHRYSDGHPHQAIETETIGQSTLVEILTARLDALLPEPLAAVIAREHQQRAELIIRDGDDE